MFNKCAAPKCASGYASNEKKHCKISFSFKKCGVKEASGLVLSIEETG